MYFVVTTVVREEEEEEEGRSRCGEGIGDQRGGVRRLEGDVISDEMS